MTTAISDVKACPFCGAVLAHQPPRHRRGYSYHQHPSNDCILAKTSKGDPFIVFDDEEHIAAWNRRPATESRGPIPSPFTPVIALYCNQSTPTGEPS